MNRFEGQRSAEMPEAEVEEPVLKLLKELKDSKQEASESALDKRLADLPQEISRDIRSFLADLEGQADSGLVEKMAEKMIEIATSIYIDSRFNLPNQVFYRLQIRKHINEMIEKGEDEKRILDKVKGFGVLSFDINGLKAVNDNAGHSAGDEYLGRVAKCFESGQTTTKLKNEFGIDASVFVCGGDEFSIILQGGEDFDEAEEDGFSLLQDITHRYQEEIGRIDCSDLLDFSDADLKKRFDRFGVPDGFRFTATASAGSASLEQAMADFRPQPGKSYQDSINALMGLVIDRSDRAAALNKESYKQVLAESVDPDEKFMSLLLKRNSESMGLEEENRQLRRELADLKSTGGDK